MIATELNTLIETIVEDYQGLTFGGHYERPRINTYQGTYPAVFTFPFVKSGGNISPGSQPANASGTWKINMWFVDLVDVDRTSEVSLAIIGTEQIKAEQFKQYLTQLEITNNIATYLSNWTIHSIYQDTVNNVAGVWVEFNYQDHNNIVIC